jgi:GTP cyclohydrolase II
MEPRARRARLPAKARAAPRTRAAAQRRAARPREAPVDRGAIGLPADLREFGIGAQILLHQGVRKLRLITGTPSRIKGIEGYGLEVVEHITMPPGPVVAAPAEEKA